jgi:hypothetical protein
LPKTFSNQDNLQQTFLAKLKKMKNNSQKKIGWAIILIAATFLSSFSQKEVQKKEIQKQEPVGFAVLELFTSQGCSSCPPADAIIGKYALQNNPTIIPLAFHVDYWDNLGWKDPFSKPEFSERQRQYATILNTQGNYTPQLVINGKRELVGSNENAIRDLISQELAIKKKFTLNIEQSTIKEHQLIVLFDKDDNDKNVVLNFALVKKKEVTNIKRGENNGLKSINYNIVYDFKTVKNDPKSKTKMVFQFKEDWLASDFMVVAYIQNLKTGAIVAVTKSEIN